MQLAPLPTQGIGEGQAATNITSGLKSEDSTVDIRDSEPDVNFSDTPYEKSYPDIIGANIINQDVEDAKIEEKREREFEQPESRALSDLEDRTTLDIDWDAGHQARFVKWVMQEKTNRQNEKGMLALHWKRLKEERKIFEIRRKEFEDAEADLAQCIRDVKDLIPVAKELKENGVNFSLINSWLAAVKEMSQRKGLDIRSAAWKLAEDLKNWQELGGFETAIQNSKHQLSLLQIASENQKSETLGSPS